jgi:hypothetical protein
MFFNEVVPKYNTIYDNATITPTHTNFKTNSHNNVRYVSCIINFNRIYAKIVKQYAYVKFVSFGNIKMA